MRCCLINPLYYTTDVHSPPLGLAYIASMLEANGHEVKILDRPTYKDKTLADIDWITQSRIMDFQPDLIGIGSMTIQIYDTKHVAALVKRMSFGGNYPIIVGGYHASAEPELTLRECPEIDMICGGEGEFTMLQLASGNSPQRVEGLTFRQNGSIVSTPIAKPIKELDILPMPAWHLLDMEYYTQRTETIIPNVSTRASTLVGSRGCPYNCKFCANRTIYKSVRYHSVEYILKQIEYLLGNYKLDAISFLDSTFLSNREITKQLCQKLIETRLNKKFKWSCCLRADVVDADILHLMKEAGCFYVSYGFESGSQRMLALMNKKTSVSQNYEAINLTNKAKMLVNSAFIVNLPDEKVEDILDTIKFLKDTNIYCAGLNSLLPLAGSPYYSELLGNGTLVYSDKLWEEIGVLKSIDNVSRLYSNIPKKVFIKLCHQAEGIINLNNAKHYISRNWWRHPITSLLNLINALKTVARNHFGLRNNGDKR